MGGDPFGPLKKALSPSYRNEEDQKAHREAAHRNYIAAINSTQYIFDRANDAGNYNNNAQQYKAELISYKDRANEFAIAAETAATEAEAIYRDADIKAKEAAKFSDEQKLKISETEEEDKGFDLIRDTALNNAESAKTASIAARTAATNARQRANDIENIPAIEDKSNFKASALQIYYDVNNHLECGPPCNGTNGGMRYMRDNANEYPSNDLLASMFRGNEPKALGFMNEAQGYANGAWGKRESARVHSESASAENNNAVSNKNSAQNYSNAINNSKELVQNFANDHDYGYLNDQIDKIKIEIVRVETIKKDPHIPQYEEKFNEKAIHDASMVLYMNQIDAESKKNPFDTATARIIELNATLKECTDATAAIETEITNKKNDILNISATIKQKESEILGLEKKRDDRYSDMMLLKQTQEDLSGDLLGLQIQRDELKRSLTEDEIYFGQLQDHIKKLNLDIIYWNQKIYSNKVYNSQNLLNLSENIDHNLQYIFSDLKTQNINPELLHTKIQYRKTEEQKLTNANKVLDVIFYCFYFSFIVIMIVTRNINAEHFVYYIFIGLIPFLFPFVFKNVNYLIHSFQLDHPKNAFIESEELDNENMFHAYNI